MFNYIKHYFICICHVYNIPQISKFTYFLQYTFQWLPLENVSTGMIHVRAMWLHLSKNPADLEKVTT